MNIMDWLRRRKEKKSKKRQSKRAAAESPPVALPNDVSEVSRKDLVAETQTPASANEIESVKANHLESSEIVEVEQQALNSTMSDPAHAVDHASTKEGDNLGCRPLEENVDRHSLPKVSEPTNDQAHPNNASIESWPLALEKLPTISSSGNEIDSNPVTCQQGVEIEQAIPILEHSENDDQGQIVVANGSMPLVPATNQQSVDDQSGSVDGPSYAENVSGEREEVSQGLTPEHSDMSLDTIATNSDSVAVSRLSSRSSTEQDVTTSEKPSQQNLSEISGSITNATPPSSTTPITTPTIATTAQAWPLPSQPPNIPLPQPPSSTRTPPQPTTTPPAPHHPPPSPPKLHSLPPQQPPLLQTHSQPRLPSQSRPPRPTQTHSSRSRLSTTSLHPRPRSPPSPPRAKMQSSPFPHIGPTLSQKRRSSQISLRTMGSRNALGGRHGQSMVDLSRTPVVS